jgi:hypothetical protein
MGKKLLVSLAMEGKFSNEGLQGIEDDDDVLTAMARELVTQRGVGESASAVWKLLRSRNSFHYPESDTIPTYDSDVIDVPRERAYGPATQLSLFE